MPEVDRGRREVVLPSEESMRDDLLSLGRSVDAVARYLAATASNFFVHPDGRREALEDIVIPPAQAAVLAHLCTRCSTRLSIEIGFGMGSSACVILGARRHLGKLFDHVVIDPYGLSGATRGVIVEAYLKQAFEGRYHRIWRPSVIGMGQIVEKYGREISDFIHIDGDHHFEYVVADFLMADMLCRVGGYITFDDCMKPALESALNYIAANRPDYSIVRLPAADLAVLQKLDADRRPWYAFQPFPVAQRRDWTTAASTGDAPGETSERP